MDGARTQELHDGIPVSQNPAPEIQHQQARVSTGNETAHGRKVLRPPSAAQANHDHQGRGLGGMTMDGQSDSSPSVTSAVPISTTAGRSQPSSISASCPHPPEHALTPPSPATAVQSDMISASAPDISRTPPSPAPGQPAVMRRRISTSRQYTEDFDSATHDKLYTSIPDELRRGTVMLKVSAKKTQRRMVRLKAEAGQVVWESKHAGMLSIDNIRELRFGSDARGFREQFRIAPDSEPRWISIIYTHSGKYKILHLVALSSQLFDLWKSTLLALHEQRKELQMGGLDQTTKRQSIWLKQHYSAADLDDDQILDYKDVTALVRNLNISASEKDMKYNFEKADIQKRGYLDFADFQTFVKLLRRRPEIEKIMSSVAGSSEHMLFDHFQCFMKTVQKTTLDDARIAAIYKKFSEPMTNTSPLVLSTAASDPSSLSGAAETQPSGRVMTNEGFTGFLMSSDNMAMDERQLQVCDDMRRPLCEYYISSSHNTYLIGGQLKGESTAEGYIRALQQGCRSVELDVWDGPDEPVVYHGRTLTSRLPAREALAAIGKYAFVASPYPVILSMEVHCDHGQQDKLAEILKSTLGRALVDRPLFGEELVEAHAGCPVVATLPSPEELKHRILVKAKNMYVVKAAGGWKGGEKGDDGSGRGESEESSSASSSDSDLKKVFSSAMRIIRRDPGPSDLIPPSPGSPPPPSLPSTQQHPVSPKQGYFAQAPVNPGAPVGRQLPGLEQSVSRESSSISPGSTLSATAAAGGIGNGNAGSSGSGIGRRLSLVRLRSRSGSHTSGSGKSVGNEERKKGEKPLMSFALASLIVYTVGVKWRGLNKKEEYGASHVISLGERRGQKVLKEGRNDLIAHNRTHLVRSYPAGTRFTSSNYLPLYFWAGGVQLVALNWQTYDLGTELNAALFRRNGRSGYVLKPGILRMKRDSAKDKEVLGTVEKYVLMLEVLSAQQLPRPREGDGIDESTSGGSGSNSVSNPGSSQEGSSATSKASEREVKNVPMNPYIEVAIHTPTVSPGDVYKFRTPIVHGNGFNPVFDTKLQIPFTVPVDMLDLAFLRMEVMVRFGGDELSLGKYTTSIPVLMPGYRHVPLYDHLGQQYLFSSLFIYTQLQKQS